MSEVQYRQDENGLYYTIIMDDEGNPLPVEKQEARPVNNPHGESVNATESSRYNHRRNGKGRRNGG